MCTDLGGAVGDEARNGTNNSRSSRWRRRLGSLRLRLRPAGLFLLGLLPAVVFYLINAHERFGGWWDKLLWLWFQQDAPTIDLDPHYGPFSLHYLPFNLYTALFLAPQFQPSFPWIMPTFLGQSLLTTSPALLLALRSRRPSLWAAALLCMAGALTVYANGHTQVGCRYWILAYPFLLLMMQGPMDRLATVLIVASVVLMTYQIWFWRVWA